ncbi:MAG: hypothetical protein ACKV2Q_08890 [Planctomycetaceae bacterium]
MNWPKNSAEQASSAIFESSISRSCSLAAITTTNGKRSATLVPNRDGTNVVENQHQR